MSSSKSNTKRTRSSNSSTLKQGTFAFPTAKRTGSSTSSTPKAKKPATRTKSAPSPVAVEAIDSSSSSSSSISSEGEERIESDEYGDTPARAVSSTEQKKTSKVVAKGKAPLRSRVNTGGSPIDLRADNPGKWRKHYGAVREKMGNLEPIHIEDQNKVNYILRVFDMSYEYGPCVGITRLERWQRAQALGLNPPVEVHEILSTKQGTEEDEFKQSVLYGMV